MDRRQFLAKFGAATVVAATPVVVSAGTDLSKIGHHADELFRLLDASKPAGAGQVFAKVTSDGLAAMCSTGEQYDPTTSQWV